MSARTAALTAVLPVLATGVLTATASPVSAAVATVRVGTGATAVVDSTGATWSATRGFTGGKRFAVSSATAIAGTEDDALYRTEHFGMSAFSQPVVNGTYTVTLRMAEIYWGAAGKRVFDVTAEGRAALTSVDVFAAVGKNAKYDRSFTTTVADGVLDVGFVHRTDVAKVSAISIAPGATTTATPTTSPTTTTTTTTTVAATRPGPTNTGVPAGTVLRPYHGNLTITTPGAVYDALDIHGFVTIKAPNVTIKRSRIRGGVATGNIGLVTNYTPTATGFVLEDSELAPAYPSVWLDGAKGANFTLRRVNSHGTVDNVKVHGPNVVVENSWLHDSRYFASDPNQGGKPTHNDGVQVLGGRNIRISGNTITGARNAALMVTQDYSATTDLHVTGNHLDGGACTVNLAHKKLTSMSGLVVRDNRFGRGSTYNCPFLKSSATSVTTGNNAYADNGAPVTVRVPV